MKILNGISVVHSWMTRQVDCEILADVSKDNGAVIALKTGWAPGQLWTFMKKKFLLFLESSHEIFIYPSRTAALNVIN